VRQFPHAAWRFNLTEQQLRALVVPWARAQVVELGERKWNPQQARIAIVEGPQLAMAQLSMGRGWRAAQREGNDVTERVLAAARQADVPAAAAVQRSDVETGPQLDPLALGVQLASLLGEDPSRLLAAWRAVAARRPELAPSESLALAERELGSFGSSAD
jgi:hypothetical protein